MSVARSLAIVVSTEAEHGDLDRALALARGARVVGVEVGLFFMDHAVAGLPARRTMLSMLSEDGCQIIACAASATALGLSETDVGMLLGSQDDHAALVHRSDRLLAFT